ncbi:DnaJ-domain-containing protein [Canariomyces notabilis]|uniref:DnaJ-domain-containing protein n=1 Tax=Canariomyces notabilis TaxID=2074819 RepID=A0AAN6QP14_9PEZI|nr:DnaJ-domain-containing protein [Canariomyces arenarius]
MAPARITHDYYVILGVTQSADETLIRSSYKRLAKLKHPDKDLNNPEATAQFQLLQAAYSTLSDPAQRRDYDTNHYPFIRFWGHNTANSPLKTTSQSKSANETDSPEDEVQKHTVRLSELDAKLSSLRERKSTLYREHFEAKRSHDKVSSSLAGIDEEAKRDAMEEAAQRSWYNMLFGPRVTPEEREARTRRKTERLTGRLVLEAESKRYKTRVNTLQNELDEIEGEINKWVNIRRFVARQRENAEQEARLAEKQRQQEEQARKEEAERLEREKKRREEREASLERKRKQAEAMHKWEEEQRTRLAEERKRRAEREQRAEQDRKAQDAQRAKEEEEKGTRKRGKAKQKTTENGAADWRSRTSWRQEAAPANTNTACLHKGWWEYRDGRHLCQRCQRCQRRQVRCAFCCPGCGMMACASCRDILKGKETLDKK